MNTLLIIYITIIGLILGSFYNVVGLRVPLKESVVAPRSSCPKCKKVLTYIELIPVLSYIVQKGKCRSCQAPISPIYPFMEFMTGLLFSISPFIIGWRVELIFCYALISLLIIITVSDLAYMIIPDKILIFFTAVFLFLHLTLRDADWLNLLLGAMIGFGLLLLIAVVSKGGMGGGDIKLFALLGFILGVKNVLLSFFFAVFLGAVIGLLLMALGIVEKKKPIPFGPFIAIGALLSYYFGESFLNWYFQIFI